MATRASRSIDYHNILLGLAYLGGLTRDHVQRLWGLPERTAERALARLQGKEGQAKGADLAVTEPLITSTPWYTPGDDGTPRRRGFVYHLTPAGHALIRTHEQYPRKAVQFRPKIIEHDMRTVAAIVRLIELARPADLSGVNIELELRLDPLKPRPRADALVILQVGGGYDRLDLVPWSRDPAVEDERRYRFAIESDNDTEPASVIRAKAEAYAAMHEDADWRAWWVRQHGRLPVVLWVVPHARRMETVLREWDAGYSDGAWLVTTDTGLTANAWSQIRNGQLTSGPVLLATTPPPQPKPAAPALLPAPVLTPEERHAQERRYEIVVAEQATQDAARVARELAVYQCKEEMAAFYRVHGRLIAEVDDLFSRNLMWYSASGSVSYLISAERNAYAILPLDGYRGPVFQPVAYLVVKVLGPELARQTVAISLERERRKVIEKNLAAANYHTIFETRAEPTVDQPPATPVPTPRSFASTALVLLALLLIAGLLAAILPGLLATDMSAEQPTAVPTLAQCGRWAQIEPIPLRPAPSLNSTPIRARLPPEAIVTSLCWQERVREQSGGRNHDILWTKVRLDDGTVGWVNHAYLRFKSY